MLKRLKHICALLCAIQVFLAGVGAQSEARDLTDVLGRGFVFNPPQGSNEFGFQPGKLESVVDFSEAARGVGPAFSAAIARSVTQEFPSVSASPAFIYRLNPAMDAYERLTGVPGPLYSERALTLGNGRLNFSVGYSFIDYSDFNGKSLKNLKSLGLFVDIPDEERMELGRLPTGETLVAIPFALSQLRTRIDLTAHIVAPTLRYGLTDRWELSITLPIVNTFLRVRNEMVRTVDLATVIAEGGPEGIALLDPARNPIDLFAPPEELERQLFQYVKSFVKGRRSSILLSRTAGSATGVGDMTLRSKYQFWEQGFGGAALGLNLQLPTGEVNNFHGTGQTHVIPFLYLSRVFREQFEPHINVGIDFNADDVARSSVLYAVGGTLRIGSRLGVMIDLLGRSEFGRLPIHIREEDKVTGGVLDRAPDSCSVQQPCRVAREDNFSVIPIKIRRNDILNFSFGLRYALGTSGSVFFGGILPLNNDGFRADFIPSGGVEYTF